VLFTTQVSSDEEEVKIQSQVNEFKIEPLSNENNSEQKTNKIVDFSETLEDNTVKEI